MQPLAKAQVDFNQPKAEAKARSSVEVSDSCNCFKFCFPCCVREVKQDPRTLQAQSLSRLSERHLGIPNLVSAAEPPAVLEDESQSDKPRRTHKTEHNPDITMHLESRDNILTIDVSKRSQEETE